MTAWRKVAEPLGRRLAVVAAWRGNRLVLLWPLALVRVGLWTIAQHLGAEAHDPGEILIAPDEDAPALHAQARRAVAKVADVLRFAFVHADGQLYGLLGAQLAARSTASEVAGVEFERFANFESWRDNLSQEQRRNLRNRWRRLEEAGPVAIELAATPERVAQGIDFLIRHKLAWCEATGRDPVGVADPMHQAFLEAVASEALANGNLVMPLLLLSGEVIAAELNFRYGRRLVLWMAAYDAAWHKMSPGTLLLAETVAWSFSRRLARYEMGPHDHGYKQRWCPHPVAAVERVLAPLTFWGEAYCRARDLRNRLKRPTAST